MGIVILVQLFCGIGSAMAMSGMSGVSQVDSVQSERELDEVVVTAASQYTVPDGMGYLPGKKAKKFADSAASLLHLMGIPSLNTQLGSESVTTKSGENVAMFIDYLPADAQELRGILPADVLRVEVLDFPADPRFNGAAHVVNFIMRRYEYGGYVKGRAKQGFVVPSGDYGLFNRTSYKRMTYSISAGYNYSHPRSGEMWAEDSYIFPDMTFQRLSQTEEQTTHTESAFASARIAYQSKATSIVNTLGFSFNHTPLDGALSSESFSNNLYPPAMSLSERYDRGASYNWSGNYGFGLPGNYYILVAPTLQHSHNVANTGFEADEKSYMQNMRENTNVAALQVFARKGFGNHALALRLYDNYYRSDLDYTGQSVSAQSIWENRAGVTLMGNSRINRVGLFYGAGVQYVASDKMGYRYNYLSPLAQLSLNWNISNVDNINFNGSYEEWNQSMGYTNSNLVQLNLVDAVKGNEKLRKEPVMNLSLSYSRYISRNVSGYIFSNFHWRDNTVRENYYPYLIDGAPVMVREYVNHGHYTNLEYGVSVSWRFLGNSFMVKGDLKGNYTKNNAFIPVDGNFFSGTLGVDYMLDHWHFSGQVMSPVHSIMASSEVKGRWWYALMASYVWGNLNASVTLCNPFCGSWQGMRTIVDTPNYKRNALAISDAYHRSVAIGLTYTFGYGKRVEHDAEFDDATTSNSAILRE